MNKFVGGIVLLGLIIFIVIIALTLSTSVDLSAEEHAAFESDNEHIQDRVNNLFDIYTAGTANNEKQEFDDLEHELERIMVADFKYITMVTSVVEVFTIVVLAASFYVLYKAYGTKTMTNESIISVILVLTYFLSYFSKISSNYIGLTDVFGYSRESDRFLKEINGNGPVTTLSPTIHPHAPSTLHGPIEFKNVSFKYPVQDPTSQLKHKKVLNGASLYIKPGSKVAIYGKSGSGKSTIIKLLLGFYGIESGSIMIGGKNIKDMPIEEIRRNISVVNQNVKLFDKTIFENMTYGINDEVTEDDIKKIIGNPNIFEGVAEGLSAGVGVSGSKLSGGQKQIINVVRSILKDAPILVLDEPTSALDQNTKRMILNVIKKLKGKTVLIISHDKEILKHVDKAYELINGKLKMI
jgi:ABC-type multidrug transport system fused ATPase/permease subunit